MTIQESGEMYLETILLLSKKKNNVRAIDVSEEMGFSKPSVSRAIGKLKADNYITVSDEGFIKLTRKGKSIAEKIYERHTILTDLLIKLGVTNECAVNDACRIEHVISDESFEAIKKYMK